MAVFPLGPPVAAFFLALLFGMGAIALARGKRARLLVPVAGVLLAAVAILGLIPELGAAIGWVHTLALAGVGYGILAVLDHRGYPVCPSCSHGEKFTTSLVVATAFHAFVDGWGMAATENEARVGTAIAAAILVHKIPEGLALGSLLRISTTGSRAAALMLVAAELPTVLGGFVGLHGTPGVWVNYPLAIASGTFVFLGFHATSARK